MIEADPSTVKPPRRKRRWFQFSLRTLLIFTMASAIACGWIGKRIEQKRYEREAARAIEGLGGSVRYDYRDATGAPAGPAWLRNLAGDNFFSAVVEVNLLGNPDVTDNDLAQLEELRDLQALDIFDTKITNGGLIHLERLTKLKRLFLGYTRITDAGLKHLQALNQLGELSLWKTDVTDSGLKCVEELTTLRELYLHSTRITDAGLASIRGLNHLEWIDLAETKVTETGVKTLRNALPSCVIVH
jgi:hypothetical protein